MAASKYLTLGRGLVRFAPFYANTLVPAGFEDFGNCPEFNINISFEELEHMDSRGGFKEEDENAMIARTLAATINCDDLNPENLGKWSLGSNTTLQQSSATGEVYTITTAQQGRSYQIGATSALPTGVRDLSSVVITDSVPTTYDINDDYTIDLVRGIITIVEGGGIADDTTLTVTFDQAAGSRTQVEAGQVQLEGALLFLADNAIGANQDLFIPHVKIRPEGDLSFITDDWSAVNFNLRGLKVPGQSLYYLDGQSVAS